MAGRGGQGAEREETSSREGVFWGEMVVGNKEPLGRWWEEVKKVVRALFQHRAHFSISPITSINAPQGHSPTPLVCAHFVSRLSAYCPNSRGHTNFRRPTLAPARLGHGRQSKSNRPVQSAARPQRVLIPLRNPLRNANRAEGAASPSEAAPPPRGGARVPPSPPANGSSWNPQALTRSPPVPPVATLPDGTKPLTAAEEKARDSSKAMRSVFGRTSR